MSTLTIRLPDDKHERLTALAEVRKISVNKLGDELATIVLANYDERLRFEMRARRGSARRALTFLTAWAIPEHRCTRCIPSNRHGRDAFC